MSNPDLDSLLQLAATGDARPALRAAARLRRQAANEPDQNYRRLLEAVLISSDADAIAWAAEALQHGEILIKDIELSADFLKRADELSGFMGAFLMGKMMLRADWQIAYEMFSRAARLGHIPSRAMMRRIWYSRHPILGVIVKPIISLVEAIYIFRALKKKDAPRRFWRYKDAFTNPAQILNDRFGAASESPFLDLEA